MNEFVKESITINIQRDDSIYDLYVGGNWILTTTDWKEVTYKLGRILHSWREVNNAEN